MSKAEGYRRELLNYLLMVKEFYTKLYTGSIMTKMQALFPEEKIDKSNEPVVVRIARAEKLWLKTLFTCLFTINQMLLNIEKWRDWFLSLVQNLNFADQNLETLSESADVVLDKLHDLDLDDGYVRLLVNNATSDFMDLVEETRRLLNELLNHMEFIKQLESTFLRLVEDRLYRLKEVNFRELLTRMQQLLAAAYNAPTKEDFLRNLANLLHVLGGWRRILQLDDPSLDDPKKMREFLKATQSSLRNLNELTLAFKEFVDARNLADYYIRQAELSLIRMMLSYEGSAEQWWVGFIEANPENIEGFIPGKIDPHQLLIGVTHSLALLEDLDQRLLPQIPGVKTTVGKLEEFLQSPNLHLYEEITQNRLALWNEYGSQWVSLLLKLRTELHAFNKKISK
ncbi:MAG: hypothetical protein ACFFD8_03610 [Candidatus Thorarchaeota archaeon]